MKIYYEVLGKSLPEDCRTYEEFTYCLNCKRVIKDVSGKIKEYCNVDCQMEHEQIMRYVIED